MGKVGRRVIEASFDGGDISSDVDVLLLRRADERIGSTHAAARVFADSRRAASITHPVGALLAQRIYGHGVLLDRFVASRTETPQELILDIDATHVPLHGEPAVIRPASCRR